MVSLQSPAPPAHRRWKLLARLFLTASLGLAPVTSLAQQGSKPALDGYITGVQSPDVFDVQGKHFRVSAITQFGCIGSPLIQTGEGMLHQALGPGVFVRVQGVPDQKGQVIDATAVYLRNNLDQKLSGFGVIDKIVSAAPDLTFRADGYLLHITPSSDLSFGGDLNSLTDIVTNTWVRYQGERDSFGVLQLTKARFLPARSARFSAIPVLEVDDIQVKFPHAGKKEKLRYSQSENLFRVIDDPSLQERMHRVGMSIVPAYQKALPAGNPSKINFEFYAVDSPSLRWETCTRDGTILIPKITLERLKREDQLAAVLADGIAYELQRQSARLTALNRELFGAEMAGDVVGAFVPGLQIPVIAGSVITRYIQLTSLAKQRGRIALSLLKDAGYQLNQAPEAWRLLLPEKLPADLSTLRYPDLSVYQMSEIYAQYRDDLVSAKTTV